MLRLREGMKVAFDIGDIISVYGLGCSPGLVKVDDTEADVFARILARRADEGAKWAVEQVEKLVGYSDYVEAGLILLGKGINVITEVKTNGINPFFLKQPGSPG